MNPYLIGIAGPSCAGKSELARRVAERLSATVLSLDCYYHDLSQLSLEERAQFNFDLPDALDHALFAQHVHSLGQGRSIERPVYDFSSHCRTGAYETVQPSRFVVVEGLFVLYWEDVRACCGSKVFVELEDDRCLARRRGRDVRERGRTPESVLRQFKQTVAPMATRYVRPTSRFADVIVRGDWSIESSLAAVLQHVRGQTPSCFDC